ncbi:MAG: hypothetical protein ABIO65_11695 [Nitrospiria bacterium]
MTEEFQEALLQVAKAMDGLTTAFEHRVTELRAVSNSDEQVGEVIKAIQAVKDSGAIYLTWANHYAKRISDQDGNDEDEDLMDDAMETDA